MSSRAKITRRRTLGRAVVVAFGILLAALTVVALVMAVRAGAAERTATKHAEEAAAGRLAAEGEGLADHRPDLAMLLGAAWALAVDDAAQQPVVAAALHGGDAPALHHGRASVDGPALVAGGDQPGRLHVRDVGCERPPGRR